MGLISLLIKEITDPYLKQNFKTLDSFLKSEQILLSRFQHLDRTFSTNETFTIPHTLGAVPQDVIQTRKLGTGTITYNYSDFTVNTVSITITGTSDADPVKLRFFVGTYGGA